MSTTSPHSTNSPNSNAWVGYAVAAFIAFFILARGCSAYRTAAGSAPSKEQFFAAQLNKVRQELFDRTHPIGTAKSVTVHEVQEVSGPGGQRFIHVRFTLFWEGPIVKDGYTKILLTWDPEIRRTIGAEILDTNGVTNSDFQRAMFDIGFAVGEAAARGK